MGASEKKWAGILSAAVIALFIAINFGSLWGGNLRLYDEFATLDRSHSVYTRGEYSVVYTDNRPTFRKPPLQYWMSAGLMNAGLPPLFSARFPSFLFGLLLVVCTGLLTYVLYPQQPLAAAAAVALMACNARLLESAMMAMLDTGAAFFCAVAMTGCILALRNPRWWYLVAVACGLGALQKAPIALTMTVIAVLALWAARRFQLIEPRGPVFERHFWLATLLALVMVLAWPLLQWSAFGFAALKEAYYVQMVQRFTPVADTDLSRSAWHRYILHDDRIFRIPAIVAMCALPFVLKRRELLIFALLLGLYAIAVVLTKGQIYPRYSIVFLPFIAAALAICLFHFVKARWIAAVAVLVFCAQNILIFERRESPLDARTIASLKEFGSKIVETDSIVLCDWTAGKSSKLSVRIPPGMFSFYASGGRPFFPMSSPANFQKAYSAGLIGPKLQGFCTEDQLKTIEHYLRDPAILDQYGDYLHWRSS